MRKNNTLIILKLIIIVNILFFFNSCSNDNPNVFFIGGEIINPSSSNLNIYRNNIKIDSIELDEENKFFKQLMMLAQVYIELNIYLNTKIYL